MPARRARDAVRALTDSLTRVATCVTDRPLLATGLAVGEPQFVSFLPLREAAPLRLDGVRGVVAFDIRIDYVVTDVSAVSTPFDVVVGYSFRLVERTGREILVFHWHPEGPSPVTYPHIHLSGRIRPIPLEPVGSMLPLADHHIPTGPVPLADVVRYLITEAGVEPRRPDGADVLAGTDGD